MKIWTWRHAIQKAQIKSNTKLVLFNLSIYMNERGESCFPTIEKQMRDTGLSKATVHRCLNEAREAGLITVKKHGFSGQKWANNEYMADVPDSVKGSITQRPPKEKVVSHRDEGSINDVQKVVSHRDTNSSINSPINSPEKYTPEFEQFWKCYPLKKDKYSASLKFNQALKHTTAEILITKAQEYKTECELKKIEKCFIKHGKTWLYNRCWEEEYERPKKQNVPF